MFKATDLVSDMIYITDTVWLQDFDVDASEKFVEEASIPVVTLFNKDPDNHPFVIKFFNSPNAKVNNGTAFCSYMYDHVNLIVDFIFRKLQLKFPDIPKTSITNLLVFVSFFFHSLFLSS